MSLWIASARAMGSPASKNSRYQLEGVAQEEMPAFFAGWVYLHEYLYIAAKFQAVNAAYSHQE